MKPPVTRKKRADVDPILTIRTFASALGSGGLGAHDEHVVRIGMTKLQWRQLDRLRSVARDNQLEYVSRYFPEGLWLDVRVHEGGHNRVDHFKVAKNYVEGDGEEVRREFAYLHIGPREIWVTYRSKDHDGPKWESDHVSIADIEKAWPK